MPQAIGLAIGSFLFNIGAPLALVNFFAIGAGGSLAFGIGTSLLAGAFRGRPPTSPTIRPSDGQIVTSNPVSERIKSYGRVRLAGVRFWHEAENVGGVLSDGRALNHGRIGAFVDYHIDDKVVTIGGAGEIQTSPYSTLATAEILTRLGAASETAYAEIEADFGYADVRGDGVASLLARLDNFATSELQYENFPNGQPHVKVTIDASVVWDPREAGQDREDETTWESSDNVVVCLLDYLKHREGHAIPWERFAANVAAYKTEADVCDERVLSTDAGGYENRYRCAGTFKLTDPPKDVVGRFLRTCDGRVWQKRDGTIGIAVGRFVPPTVTLRNRDILSYDMTRGTDRLSAVAGIRAQYMSPNHDYREQDAEPWPDGETVMALSEDRVAALDLFWVPSHGQAQRLMKRAYLRATAAWKGTIRTNLAGLRAIDERYVTVQIAELGIDRSFEVDKMTLDLNRMECEFAVTAVGEEIDDFDAQAEEGQPASQLVSIAWARTLNTPGSLPGYSIRNIVLGTDITAAGAQVRVRFHAESPGTSLVVSHASIVPRSGSTADGTATPTELTFNGVSGFSVAAGEQISGDWMDFDIAPGTDYLVIIDLVSGSPAYPAGGLDQFYYKSATQSWNQQAVTGFSVIGQGPIAATQIEVRNGA